MSSVTFSPRTGFLLFLSNISCICAWLSWLMSETLYLSYIPGFPRTHNEVSPWRLDAHGLVDFPLPLQDLADDWPASGFAEALYGVQLQQHLFKRVFPV